MTPYLANTMCLTDDEQYDLRAATWFTWAQNCPYQCTFCPPLTSGPAALLDHDRWLQEFQRYKLLDVELYLIRGYEPTLQPAAHIPYLQLLAEHKPVRVHTNGQVMAGLVKLMEYATGACIDIKVAPKDRYSHFDLQLYERLVPLAAQNLPEYCRNLVEAMRYVDHFQFTYFTSTTFDLLPPADQAEILKVASWFKAPFIPYDSAIAATLPQRVRAA